MLAQSSPSVQQEDVLALGTPFRLRSITPACSYLDLAENPDAPHNLLVTIELNSTSQSGTEDLVAIAFGGISEDRIPLGRCNSG